MRTGRPAREVGELLFWYRYGDLDPCVTPSIRLDSTSRGQSGSFPEPAGSVRRHQPPQFLGPVLDDDDLASRGARRVGEFRPGHHADEPTVGQDVIRPCRVRESARLRKAWDGHRAPECEVSARLQRYSDEVTGRIGNVDQFAAVWRTLRPLARGGSSALRHDTR